MSLPSQTTRTEFTAAQIPDETLTQPGQNCWPGHLLPSLLGTMTIATLVHNDIDKVIDDNDSNNEYEL